MGIKPQSLKNSIDSRPFMLHAKTCENERHRSLLPIKYMKKKTRQLNLSKNPKILVCLSQKEM